MRTALQHRLRIPFLAQEAQCLLCCQVLHRFCDHAAVRPCAGRPQPQTQRGDQCLRSPGSETSTHRKRRQVSSSLDQTPTDVSTWPAATVPPSCEFRKEKTLQRKPGTLQPPRVCAQPRKAPTQNLADYESPNKTFHKKAAGCHDNRIRFIPAVFDGPAGGRDCADPGHLGPTAYHHLSSHTLDLAEPS